jgi:hypothetical protein
MTQRQLDLAKFCLKYDDFKRIEHQTNRVMCVINDRFSIVVTQRLSDEVYVLIRSGNKCLKLPESIFDAVCNSQLSVDYLKGLLREELS